MRELTLDLEVQKELPNLRFGGLIGAALGEVGQLPDGADVAIVSAFRLAGALPVRCRSSESRLRRSSGKNFPSGFAGPWLLEFDT